MKYTMGLKRTFGKIDDSIYTRTGRLGDACVYCGDISDTLDHVPPLSFYNNLPSDAINNYSYYKYPCCRKCNSILGNRLIIPLEDRRNFIKEQLKIKYKKYLSTPEWSKQELRALGGILRKEVENGIRVSKRIKKRLDY